MGGRQNEFSLGLVCGGVVCAGSCPGDAEDGPLSPSAKSQPLNTTQNMKSGDDNFAANFIW